jgi:protein-tyrosine phosphatase
MSLSNFVYALSKKLKINEDKYDDINRIMPKVFIGNYHAARDKGLFEKYNIKAVLNCTKDLPNSFRSSVDIEYMRIPIDDSLREVDFIKLLNFFPVATHFIEKHANIQKNAILVHCVEGSQRSCASVVAYLMEMYNMSPEKACETVLTKRHKAFHHGTNVNFEKSIKEYYRRLLKQSRR